MSQREQWEDHRSLSQSQGSKPLHVATSITSLSQPTRPVVVDQPESPVTRKRADANTDHSFADNTGAQDGDNSDLSGQNGAFPPLKRSKTSPPPLQPSSQTKPSLTEYRPSQEAVVEDDVISPQTSPHLDATEPRSIVSTVILDRTLSPPLRIAVPSLVRSRTFDELRSTSMPSTPVLTRQTSALLENFSRSDETAAIGNLNLGEPSEASAVGERAMGVITSRPGSRQSSPGICNIRMTSRETTPLHTDEPLSQHHQFSYHSQPLHPLSNSTVNSPDSIVDVASPDDQYSSQFLLETSPEYDDDADDDYDSGEADTTVDEDNERIDSSDSEDEEDILDEIDVGNIQIPGTVSLPYNDEDPACKDVMTEEQKRKIIQEARKEGIAYVVQKYIMSRMMTVKKLLLMVDEGMTNIPVNCTEHDLIRDFSTKLETLMKRRERQPHIHTLEQVVELLKTSKRIMVLTGAGVSVSCGIPDFRSPDGIYARLSEFALDDPTQMFDLEVFCDRPELFYSFAREIYPSNFSPSPSHNFVKLIEDQGKLLRNYTQNIDTLEQKAGIHSVLQCHGSFATASCIRCRHQVDGSEIKDSIMRQEVAYCKVCPTISPRSSQPTERRPPRRRSFGSYSTDGELSDSSDSDSDYEDWPPLMKPDIVFFHEPLSYDFNRYLDEDKDKVDLLIVMGSSLKVEPVSNIMYQLPPEVPQILINRTPIMHTEFDVQLLGNCDTIVAELCRMAGWELKHEKLPGGTSNVPDMATNTNLDGSGEGGRAGWVLIEPNTYQFEGAILTEVDYEQSQSNRRKRAYTEDDEGITTANGGFGRRQSNHQEKFGRLRMDTESESEGSQEDENRSKSTSGHSRPSNQNSSLVFSPKPHFGFAYGTTEPHSGDIADLHKAISEGGGDTLSVLTQSRRESDTSSLVQQEEEGEDEEETEMREKFTEVMPKDLGESSDDAMDRSDESSHSRRSSMTDLEPISEEPAMDGVLTEQGEVQPVESMHKGESSHSQRSSMADLDAISEEPAMDGVLEGQGEVRPAGIPDETTMITAAVSEPESTSMSTTLASNGGPQAMVLSADKDPSQESNHSFELPPFTAEEMAEVDKIDLDI
ncbi:NAD-dependent histone deacetylase sir2 [Mortierella antarctica]|nr:NAD-dependent histone deacetylase sir2 [Mortierella antarctica]